VLHETWRKVNGNDIK